MRLKSFLLKFSFSLFMVVILSGCMVTPLKRDKTIQGQLASYTFVDVPNTLRFDGFLIPAGKYLPVYQSDDSVYYQSRNLVVSHGFSVPKTNREGGIRISESGELLSALMWYWEGGYTPWPSLQGKDVKLYRVDEGDHSVELVQDFREEGLMSEDETQCNGSLPPIRLIIQEPNKRTYTPDFNTMIYDYIVDSSLFCEIKGESESALNTIFISFQGEYDESKQNELNMWASALTGGLLPFKHNWNYKMYIKVVNEYGLDSVYSYTGDTAEFVNIISDMNELHVLPVKSMLDKFLFELKTDGAYESMYGLAL